MVPSSANQMVAVVFISCLLWRRITTAGVSCPVVKTGRVVCLQAELCSPGVPLQTPGCGPGATHVCCLKSEPATTAHRPQTLPWWEPDLPPVLPDPPHQWAPEPQHQWKPDSPQWKPDAQPHWKPDVTQIPLWKTRPTEVPPWMTKITTSPPWKTKSTETPVPWELLPTPEPTTQPRPSAPLLQCGRVQLHQPITDDPDQSREDKTARQRRQQRRRGRRRKTSRAQRNTQRRRLRRQLLGAVGGVDAERGLWPWAALLGDRSPDGGGPGVRWICGAVLISRQHLLTAAHCVSGLAPARLLVRLAEYDVTTDSDGATIDQSPAEIIPHPQYRAKQNDIAVLRLRRPVMLGDRVQPICLPPADRDASALTGTHVLLAGWGDTAFAGSSASVLQQVALVVTPIGECENRYRRLPFFTTDFPGGFEGTKLCAGGEGGAARDACSGDSGGPLVQQQSDGSYQLVGVVAAGIGCGNPDFPGIYSRVSAYVDWIRLNSR